MKTRHTLFLGILCLFSSFSYTYAVSYQWGLHLGSTGTDRSRTTAYDADGNVYIAGSFSGTVDFDPGTGSADLTATADADIFLAKYDAAGNYVWAKALHGTAGMNEAYGLAVLPGGGVVVGGTFRDTIDFDPGVPEVLQISAGHGDAFFAVYDAAGNYVRSTTIADLYNGVLKKIAVDASGNIYVGGEFSAQADFNPGGTPVILDPASGGLFFAKYSASGNNLWARNVGPGSGSQTLNALTLDALGNVYIGGSFTGTADFDPGTAVVSFIAKGYQDFYIASYNKDGNYRWAGHAGSVANVAFVNGLSIDGEGYVNATGMFYENVDFDLGTGTAILSATQSTTPNIFVAHYDTSGNYEWAHGFGPDRRGGISSGMDLVTDAAGNLYVSGTFSYTTDFDPGPSTVPLTALKDGDIFLASYARDGKYLWAKQLACNTVLAAGSSVNTTLAMDAVSQTLYLSGSIADSADVDLSSSSVAHLVSNGGLDALLVKYADITTHLPYHEKAERSPFRLYPNPAKHQLNILHSSVPRKDVGVSLYTLTGQKIGEWEHLAPVSGTQVFHIDLPGNLAEGLYFLQLKDSEQSYMESFLISK